MLKSKNPFVKPLVDSIDAFKRNFWITIVLSAPMLIAYLLLIVIPAPTYISLGSTYLRSGSLGEISLYDFLVVALAYVVSMFFITEVVVNINIVIREEKTKTKLGKEILKGIWKYSWKIIVLFILVELLLFVVQMITIDLPWHYTIYPLIGIAVFAIIFFIPNAIVIDNLKLNKAFSASLKMLRYHWHLIVLWMVVGFVLISVVEWLLFALGLGSLAVLIVNSLLIFPYLIILQTQLYMQKYPLSP